MAEVVNEQNDFGENENLCDLLLEPLKDLGLSDADSTTAEHKK